MRCAVHLLVSYQQISELLEYNKNKGSKKCGFWTIVPLSCSTTRAPIWTIDLWCTLKYSHFSYSTSPLPLPTDSAVVVNSHNSDEQREIAKIAKQDRETLPMGSKLVCMPEVQWTRFRNFGFRVRNSNNGICHTLVCTQLQWESAFCTLPTFRRWSSPSSTSYYGSLLWFSFTFGRKADDFSSVSTAF
jgi:hypothetical protein